MIPVRLATGVAGIGRRHGAGVRPAHRVIDGGPSITRAGRETRCRYGAAESMRLTTVSLPEVTVAGVVELAKPSADASSM